MKTLQKKLLLLLLILPISMFAQNTLKGVVLDSGSQQPLPGVNIVIKGTSNGTTTDFDGNFSLEKVKQNDVIVFSYLGYKENTVIYTGQKNISVSLTEDSQQLQDVVVIGYGTVKKEDATGSVTSLTSKEFNKGTIVTADQLLTGKAAGVRITNNGGQPDAAPNIRIRGGASLNANSSPLIVIDGIPVDNTTPAGVSNPLSLINPNDIESFTVLKDASATAIYGSRASNGVIIITTKKGTKGGPEFNYSANVSFGKVTKKIDVMNGSEFTRFIQEYHPDLVDNLGVTDPVSGEQVLYNTDWQDAIYRTAISTDHNFSGRANLFGYLPFRASVGYTRNEGVVKTNDYERYSYSIKMTPSAFDNHLKIDVNAKGIYTDKNAIDEGSVLAGAVNMDPTKPIHDSNSIFGGYYQTMSATNPNVTSGQYNPIALLNQRQRPERNLRFLGNMELDYKMHFLPELRAVVNLGIDASEAKIRETFSNNALATYNGTNVIFNPGKNYAESQTITNTTFDGYLVYAKEFNGTIKKFDIQGGYSYQNFKNDGTKEIYSYAATQEQADQYGVVIGERFLNFNPNNPNNRYYNELNLQSFFGRTNIDFLNKYLLTISFRADGSSLFQEGQRWGFFPAAALAWKLKQEKLFNDMSFVNDLKLRLSAGKTGQQDITGNVGFYPSVPLFSIGSTTSQYLPGSNLYSALPFNPNLTWEKTVTYNAGLDFDFFKNNFVSGSFDIYKRFTEDLLARVPTAPGQYLSDSFINNIGKTESKGFELNLNFKPVQTDDLSFEFNTNIAYNQVKITDLGDVTMLNAGGGLPVGTNVNSQVNAVGYQPYSFWVFEQLYDNDGNVIPGAFVDRNGDGTITNDDRYFKERTPNWTFGFGFNFNYKNWDLSSSFRGQFGGQTYNTRILTSGWTNAAVPTNTNSLTNVLDFYSGAADPSFVNFNGNEKFSDYMLEDATFLRCENIVLGYRFKELIKDASFRVYGAVNNVFLVTKYSGQDPEVFGGIDNNFYPRPRVYTFGLSLDF